MLEIFFLHNVNSFLIFIATLESVLLSRRFNDDVPNFWNVSYLCMLHFNLFYVLFYNLQNMNHWIDIKLQIEYLQNILFVI